MQGLCLAQTSTYFFRASIRDAHVLICFQELDPFRSLYCSGFGAVSYLAISAMRRHSTTPVLTGENPAHSRRHSNRSLSVNCELGRAYCAGYSTA